MIKVLRNAKAGPAVYESMRKLALRPRPAHASETSAGTVRVLLMDMHVTEATASVMAAADGSASVYLSTGGGFIGGGQRHEAIRGTALDALAQAAGLMPHFAEAFVIDLPPRGTVFFYAAHAVGMSVAAAQETALRDGSSPLLPLWNVMQRILTLYRTLPKGIPAEPVN